MIFVHNHSEKYIKSIDSVDHKSGGVFWSLWNTYTHYKVLHFRLLVLLSTPLLVGLQNEKFSWIKKYLEKAIQIVLSSSWQQFW